MSNYSQNIYDEISNALKSSFDEGDIEEIIELITSVIDKKIDEFEIENGIICELLQKMRKLISDIVLHFPMENSKQIQVFYCSGCNAILGGYNGLVKSTPHKEGCIWKRAENILRNSDYEKYV